MLSYSLIRMGSIIRGSKMSSGAFIKLLSDCANPQARNFLANVIIVEVDQTNIEPSIAIWPFEECGSYMEGVKGKKVFEPNVDRALAFPFILPSGGNPLKPQGRYPVSSYLAYDAQFKDFENRTEAIEKFISGRISRTLQLELQETEIREIASLLNRIFRDKDFSAQGKKLGLMVLAVIDGEHSPYLYADGSDEQRDGYLPLGKSKLHSDKEVVVDTDKILKYFWQSTFQEGTVCGSKSHGICTLCHNTAEVVSGYNKSLSWLPTTWGGPLSFGNDQKLVESISLCKECYADLTVGASLFSRLSKLVDASLLKEIFSPVASAAAKHQSKTIQTTIYGSMIALPLMDDILEDQEARDDWVGALYNSLDESYSIAKGKTYAMRHMKDIIGFAAQVPEEWVNEDSRLTLIYYSGDPGKLDIHLRAIIEDILPSTAEKLQDMLANIADAADDLMSEYTFLSEQSIHRKKEQLKSLPYLFAVAFGAPYIWTSMQKAFQRQYIDERLFIKNFAMRMTQEAKLLPDSIFNLQQESISYFAIKSFLSMHNHELVGKGSGWKPMKNVKELIDLTWDTPVEDLAFANIDELGFATGQVVRCFGSIYYYHYKKNENDKGKDFIQHRVMTYGRSLTPDVIRYKALRKMEEYKKMLNLKVSDDILERAAVVSMYFTHLEQDIMKDKDRFMAAFWAGYSLGRKSKDENKANNAQTNSREVSDHE